MKLEWRKKSYREEKKSSIDKIEAHTAKKITYYFIATKGCLSVCLSVGVHVPMFYFVRFASTPNIVQKIFQAKENWFPIILTLEIRRIHNFSIFTLYIQNDRKTQSNEKNSRDGADEIVSYIFIWIKFLMKIASFELVNRDYWL